MNPSIPLVVSILLRDAPLGVCWTDDHDHRELDRLREIVSAWEIPEADIEGKSQQVLQSYAHELYEPGNQHVIEALGWPTDYFVPPIEPMVAPGELHLLNEYWQTTCSSGERHVIYAALQHLLGAATRADAS